MKFTGRTLYISGEVTAADIASGQQPINSGLIPIWENERTNYGYLIRFVSSFPGLSRSRANAAPFFVTSYSKRDCIRLKNAGAPGANQVLQIVGAAAGIGPAANDRVLASYNTEFTQQSDKGIIKRDALVCQSLSLAVDDPATAVTYYIELDEYELTDDEFALALLGESDQNVGNFEVRLS